jgi:hypothetical protein
MTHQYFVFRKSTKENLYVRPEKTDEFFVYIEKITGLDRAMAEVILHGGQPIEHPQYRFTAKPIRQPRKRT